MKTFKYFLEAHITEFHFFGFNKEYLCHHREFAFRFLLHKLVVSQYSVYKSIVDYLSSVVDIERKYKSRYGVSKYIAMNFQSHPKNNAFLRNHSQHTKDFASMDCWIFLGYSKAPVSLCSSARPLGEYSIWLPITEFCLVTKFRQKTMFGEECLNNWKSMTCVV